MDFCVVDLDRQGQGQVGKSSESAANIDEAIVFCCLLVLLHNMCRICQTFPCYSVPTVASCCGRLSLAVAYTVREACV